MISKIQRRLTVAVGLLAVGLSQLLAQNIWPFPQMPADSLVTLIYFDLVPFSYNGPIVRATIDYRKSGIGFITA